jgi:hypothetical protein
MNTSELMSRIRRLLLSDSPRRLVSTGLLGALIALVVLVSCGRSTRTTSPDGTSVSDNVNGEDQESAEDEAAEDAMENQVANDQAFNEAAAKGEFSTEYQAGETAPSATAGQTVVLVGAGDIANSGSGDSQTAKLIEQIPGQVFTAGDNAYSSGSTSNFSSYYNPTWGKFKSRTRPAPGNHDYNTSGAKPYYTYFGSNAGPSGRGYYSYNVGDWHVVSLNSNISMSSGSAQEKWLKADLAANPAKCTLAYWHHPRFSSGTHGSSTKSKVIWQDLYNAGAEIVVVGHDHDYERFAPMTAGGTKDLAKGIREFVAGMGGTGHRSMGKIANSEARNPSTFGVLKLTLAPSSYQWDFVPVAGKTYHDTGSGTCH